MPDPIPGSVNDPAGAATPPDPEGTPTPGQQLDPQGQQPPTPGSEPGASGQQPDGNQGADKTVPLAALHEERQRRQELQAELDVLKQIAGDNVLFDINGRPVPQSQQQQQVSPQGDTQVNAELEKLWESDPRKAVQVEIMAAMSWRDNMETQVDNQVLAAGSKYQDFNEYEGTVRQYIRSLPLEQRSKPGVVDLAYFVVKGQNANNAVERARQEMMRKLQAGNQVQGLQPGARSAPPQPKGAQLTDEQMRVADAMGLTPEQYMSAMKK